MLLNVTYVFILSPSFRRVTEPPDGIPYAYILANICSQVKLRLQKCPKRGYNLLSGIFLIYFLNQSFDQYHHYQRRHHKHQVVLKTSRQLYASALISLSQIIVEAPAPLGYTEEQVNQRTDWKQQIAYQEVLAVQHISCSDNM